MGLLPASVVKPKTVFTFGVLDDFRLTNLECHTASTSYWQILQRITSGVFPSSVPVRFMFQTGIETDMVHRIATERCYGVREFGGR